MLSSSCPNSQSALVIIAIFPPCVYFLFFFRQNCVIFFFPYLTRETMKTPPLRLSLGRYKQKREAENEGPRASHSRCRARRIVRERRPFSSHTRSRFKRERKKFDFVMVGSLLFILIFFFFFFRLDNANRFHGARSRATFDIVKTGITT